MSSAGQRNTTAAAARSTDLRRDVTVLVVDDEPAVQESLARFLGAYRRFAAYNGRQTMEMLAKHHVDVVLLDLNLPDTTGYELLQRIRAERDDVEVIVVTSHTELPNAVKCTKAGAFDFLAKSFENYQTIGEHIERALEHRRQRRAAILYKTDENLREALTLLESTGAEPMADVLKLLRQVAPTPLTVLIEGESGVGKELLARYVHLHSGKRADASFVPVNMAAIPPTLLESTLFGHERGAYSGADKAREGKFELADKGTLFLDEVGELDPAAQVKLLRALQERQVERLGAKEPAPVDVRVVAATNKDLEAEVIAGRFREDLWFRLNVVRLRVPPLRQRRQDIPALLELLARRHAHAMNYSPPKFGPKAIKALMDYSWPGNVRELENLVMRMVALYPGGVVRLNNVPVEYCIEHLSKLAVRLAERGNDADRSHLYALACDHFERYIVKQMIERCGGNKAEAARRLGVSYATVKNKIFGDSPDGGGEAQGEDDEP